MDDIQIISSEKYQENKRSRLKIFLIFFLLLFVSAGVAGISFLLGKNVSNEVSIIQAEITPVPTTQLTLAENIVSATPIITKKPTPTGKNPSVLTVTPTDKPVYKTKILSCVAELDGFRSSNGGGNSLLEIRAGRNSSLVTRGFLSFEISSIPSAANIQSATLRLYQIKTSGNPYNAGGKLKLDHLTYGDALDETDYSMPALTSNFATLSENNKVEWKEVDVTPRLKDDVANARSLSQFRLHFETEVTGEDLEGDFVYFESADNSSNSKNSPQLVVKYY